MSLDQFESRQKKHGDTHTHQCCPGVESEEGNVSSSNERTYADDKINTKPAEDFIRKIYYQEGQTLNVYINDIYYNDGDGI